MKVHCMKLDGSPFEAIASGKKIYELRLFDEKRQALASDDIIMFTNNADGAELRVRVVELLRFPSFEELYSALPLDRCGYTPEETAGASPNDMDKYYSADLQRKYGVVAIKIEIVR